MDMEVPSYKFNASLRGVLAQRLLRRSARMQRSNVPSMKRKAVSLDYQLEFLRFAGALTAEGKNAKKKDPCAPAVEERDTKAIGTYELMKVNRPFEKPSNKKNQHHEDRIHCPRKWHADLKTYALT